MYKKILIACALSSFNVLPLTAQSKSLTLDEKLTQYNEVLLKRPESSNLFEKFQTRFLSQYDDEALEKFLSDQAKASIAGKQVYGYYLSQQGRESDALDSLNAAIKQGTNVAQLYLDRAQVYSRMLNFEDAIIDLDKALTLVGKNDEFSLKTNKLKGRYLMRQGMVDEAVAHWQKLAANNSKDEELIEDVIDIFIGDGLYEPALKHAQKLRDASRDPYKKALRTLRVADIIQKQGERAKAIKIYEETLALSGVESWLEREIIGQLEIIYRREDNLVGLEQKLSELKAKYDQRLKVHQKLAEVYSELGKYKEARELYLSILKRSPSDKSLKEDLLQVFENAQDYAASKSLIESMIKLSPEDAELNMKLAKVQLSLGDRVSAYQSLNAFKVKSEKNVASELRYINLLRKYNFDAEVLLAYQAANEMYVNHPELLFSTAEYYLMTDNKDLAIMMWDKLSLVDSVETISRLLEMLLVHGEKKRAVDLVMQVKAKYLTSRSFVTIAIKVAEMAKDKGVALELCRVALQMAESATEIGSAVKQYTRVIVANQILQEELARLAKIAQPSLKDQLLNVNLLAADGQEEAVNQLVALLSKSDNITALIQVAKIYEQRYEIQKAASAIEKIINLPNGLKARYLKQLSSLYESAGDMQKSLAFASRWKKLTPNDKQAWLREVNLLEAVEGVKPALVTLRRGMEKFEGEEEVFAKLASLYVSNENYIQARQLYWRLYDEAESLSDKIRWIPQLVKVGRAGGNVEELIAKFSERRKNSPHSITPIMSLAEVYRIEDRHEERSVNLLEALRVKPDSNIYHEMVNLHMDNGNLESAIILLRKAQKIDKTDASTKRLAKIYFEYNNIDQGLAELEKINYSTTGPRSLESVILNLMQQEAFEEASYYLRKHATKFPDDGRLIMLSALVDCELGLNQSSFDKVLKLIDGDFEMKGVTKGWEFKNLCEWSNGAIGQKISAKAAHIEAAIRASLLLNDFYNDRNYMYPSLSDKIPKNKDGLILLAQIHAIHLYEGADAKQVNKWIHQVKSVNYIPFKLLKVLASARQSSAIELLTNMILDNPSDLILHELYLAQLIANREFRAPKIILVHLKANKDKLSSSMRNLVELIVEKKVSESDQITHVYNVLKTRDKVDVLSVVVLLSMSDGFGSKSFRLNSKVVEMAAAFIAENPVELEYDLYKNNDIKSQISVWARQSLDIDILRGNEMEKVIYLLNEEYEEIKRPNIMAKWLMDRSFLYLKSKQPSIDQLAHRLSSLTSLEKYFILNGSERKVDHPRYETFDRLNPEIKLYFVHRGEFKSPMLRYLIASEAEPTKNHLNLIQINDKDDKHYVDAALLRAKWYYSKGDGEQSIAELKRIRKITRSIKIRDEIDFYLVEVGSSLKPDNMNSLKVDLKFSVQSAARRLLLGGKITDVDSIEAILTSLAMDSEKNKFITKDKKSVRDQKSQGRIIGNSFSSSNNKSSKKMSRDPWYEAIDLAKKGFRKDAIKLLGESIKKNLKLNNEYNLAHLAWSAKESKLEDSVLASFFVNSSVSPRKWLTYYIVAERLGKKDDMEKAVIFFKGMKGLPRSLTLPMISALIDSYPEEALRILKRNENYNFVLSWLGELLRERSSILTDWEGGPDDEKRLLESYFRGLDFCNRYIKDLDQEHLVENDLELLFNQFNNEKILKSTEGDFFIKEDELHNYSEVLLDHKLKFCEYSLVNIGVGDRAFMRLYRQYSTEKRDFELLENKLLKALQFVGDFTTIGSLIEEDSIINHFDLGSNILPRSCFIAERMIIDKNTDLVSDDLLSKLDTKLPKLAYSIKFNKKYELLSEDDLEKELVQLKMKTELSDFLLWDQLLLTKSSDKLDAALVKWIINSLMDESLVLSQMSYNDRPRLLVRLLNILKNDGNEKIIMKLVDDLATKALSTQEGVTNLEKWMGYLEEAQLGYMGETIEFRPRMLSFVMIMDALMTKPESVRLAAHMIKKYEYPYYDDCSFMRHGVDPHFSKSSQDWISSMEEYGYLTSPDKFRLIELSLVSEEELKNSDMPTTDLGLLFKMWDFRITEEIKESLKGIQGDKRLVAQLLLNLSDDSIGVEQFCNENKMEIINSPASFKKALVSVFNLKNNIENRKVFQKTGILGELPAKKWNKAEEAVNDPSP